jgi:predicted transport protein
MKTVERWFGKSEVKLNLNKTEIINLGKEIEIKVNNQLVKFKKQLKYLRITINDKLFWNKHIEHLKKKTI